MVYIIKRNGSVVPFNQDKIITAINKAFIEVDGSLYVYNYYSESSYECIAPKGYTQIVEIVAKKYYSDKPRVEVVIQDI